MPFIFHASASSAVNSGRLKILESTSMIADYGDLGQFPISFHSLPFLWRDETASANNANASSTGDKQQEKLVEMKIVERKVSIGIWASDNIVYTCD